MLQFTINLTRLHKLPIQIYRAVRESYEINKNSRYLPQSRIDTIDTTKLCIQYVRQSTNIYNRDVLNCYF